MGSAISKKEARQLVVDFENAEPQSEELELHAAMAGVLVRAPEVLDKINNHSGGVEVTHEAMVDDSPPSEDAAWNACLVSFQILHDAFLFSSQLADQTVNLLVELSQSPLKNLKNKQALVKQLADVFDFVLRFDDIKMRAVWIGSDFSYYRRFQNRKNPSVDSQLVNSVSLFCAYPTPMLRVLLDAVSSCLNSDNQSHQLTDNLTLFLATMANVCQRMVVMDVFANPQTNLFCLRAMTGAIVMYDHLHPKGAFGKKSPIRMSHCIKTLLNFKQVEPAATDLDLSTESLLNFLRFTTVHINDPDTPSHTRKLLD